jgi:hypothetical protein
LLVNGLEKMGIQYRGPGGLGNNLIKMAVENGLPENHYLSGEGLIETSGSLVYAKSISNNPKFQIRSHGVVPRK